MISCKLCGNPKTISIKPPQDQRAYWFCDQCNLIFVDPLYLPSKVFEMKRYLNHLNSLNDLDYLDFLNKLIKPSLQLIEKDMNCLDYGCGHNPVLSKVLGIVGIKCFDYDPLFGIDHPLEKYDFIFSTETFEHFFNPASELRKIGDLLNTGGYLGIMTEHWESLDGFDSWYYKRDCTHVSFYHSKTISFIADHYGYKTIHKDGSRVAILKKLNA